MVKHYGWRLTVHYCDSMEDMPEEFQTESCAAGTVVHFKYLEASMYVNLRMCVHMNEEEIEYVVVHELTHLLVAPLQESSESTPLEYTVTSLARIFMGLRQ